MIQRRQSLLIWCAVVLSIAGCSPVGAWWPLVVLALSLLASACIEITLPSKPDSGSTTAEPDASEAGSWDTCCDDGVITTCFCPAGAICNYAGFDFNDCHRAPDAGPRDGGVTDGGRPDGGSWDTCCENGVITTCFCPANTACNYGRFTDCGDGTCDIQPFPVTDGVCAGDAGPDSGSVDAGGSWDTCCENGVITTCFCPANTACNYGWFTNCGGGTCMEGIFPPDAGACAVATGQDAG